MPFIRIFFSCFSLNVLFSCSNFQKKNIENEDNKNAISNNDSKPSECKRVNKDYIDSTGVGNISIFCKQKEIKNRSDIKVKETLEGETDNDLLYSINSPSGLVNVIFEDDESEEIKEINIQSSYFKIQGSEIKIGNKLNKVKNENIRLISDIDQILFYYEDKGVYFLCDSLGEQGYIEDSIIDVLDNRSDLSYFINKFNKSATIRYIFILGPGMVK
jgi:hypothetical protein